MQSEPRKTTRRDPRPPRIPGYEVEGILGRGASGTVYRARQLAMDRAVALKVLKAELSTKTKLVKRLQREARTTARLAHPGIVAAIDMGECEGRWWYAMELVDGPSLAFRLRQEGRLGEREALRLFIPLCEALVHLWESGVVHRDIKPANILIDQSGRARLADLGLAFAEDDPSLTGQGGTLGTPHYISPEQAVNPRDVDVRSDIWSFGATLFHVVCGRPPFLGDSSAEVLSGVLYGKLPDPLDLEPGLRGLDLVLRKCLTRDAERRYQDPTQLLLDLERVRERRQPKVSKRDLDPVAGKSTSQRIWSGIAALVVVFGGLALWALTALEEDQPEGIPVEVLDVAPSQELSSLRQRADERPQLLSQHLTELAALTVELGAEHAEACRVLDHDLRARARRIVGEVRDSVRVAWRSQVDEHDFRAARETLGAGLDRRLLLATGFESPQALEAERVPIEAWLASQRAELETRQQRVLEDLEPAIEVWRSRRLDEVDRVVDDQDWRTALQLLEFTDAGVLSGAGFPGYRLPAADLEPILYRLRIELGTLKRQELENRWALADRELVARVEERTERLRKELEGGPPRIRASEELQLYFERLLREERLTTDKMPEALPRAGVRRFEQYHAELTELEDRLYEGDLLADRNETEGLTGELAKRREYAQARDAWDAFGLRLERIPVEVQGAWRTDLEREARQRALESGWLEELIQRAAIELRRRDGQAFDLRVGAIVYTGQRLVVSGDPLEDGFELEGLSRSFSLRSVASADLELLMGFDDPDPIERLRHALFLYHEGRVEDARKLLRGGHPPTSGPEASVAIDLGMRIANRLEAVNQEEAERSRDAQHYLELLTPERVRASPESSLRMIELLLGTFGDLAVVRARREELVELRRRLKNDGSPLAGEEDFRTAYAPDELELLPADRVLLGFDFLRSEIIGWERGDWIYDGVGWVSTSTASDWPAFQQRLGPRTALRPPLRVDGGALLLRLEFQKAPGNGDYALFYANVAGFHVALVGLGLPGDEAGPRWFVDTGDSDRFFERLRDGEGKPLELDLRIGTPHVLELEAIRRSGYMTVWLDGQRLGRVHPPPPDSTARGLFLRTWDEIHLMRLVIEGMR